MLKGGEFKRGRALHVHERDDAQHGGRREDRSKHGEHRTPAWRSPSCPG